MAPSTRKSPAIAIVRFWCAKKTALTGHTIAMVDMVCLLFKHCYVHAGVNGARVCLWKVLEECRKSCSNMCPRLGNIRDVNSSPRGGTRGAEHRSGSRGFGALLSFLLVFRLFPHFGPWAIFFFSANSFPLPAFSPFSILG